MIEMQIEIPDDVYQVLRSMAAERGVSLEDAVAALVRLGLSAGARVDDTKPFPCFAIPEPGPPITLEQTLAAEDKP
ncbi:MAG: hypothetical protein Q8N47_10865 [Bryobacterales bacterium]|nr:hypothetical protein [Bryobacterales bacterium]